ELRNAITLRQRYQSEITELRQLTHDSSQFAFHDFVVKRASANLENVPGYSGPQAVMYSSIGSSIYVTALSANSPDNKGRWCDPDSSLLRDLEQAKEGSACDGVAAATEIHERYHWDFCHQIGYLAYLDMHGADHAAEEAQAYGAQIAALKSAIAHVL